MHPEAIDGEICLWLSECNSTRGWRKVGSKSNNRPYTIKKEELEAMLNEASKRGAEAGVSAFMATISKQKANRERQVVNATKVLLKKYRDFKTMADKTLVDAASVEEESTDEDLIEAINALMQFGIDKRELDIVSNQKRVYRTKALMAHVDVMLEAYRIRCDKALNQDEQRRYRVIYEMYISPEPLAAIDIAESEHIGLTTVYDTVNKAINDLSILIFGVDGIKL